MAHCLVAGGAGFLGFHLCARLLASGHRVTCVDSYETGSRAHTTQLARSAEFTALEHDVHVPLSTVPEIAAIDSMDVIYNLACPASPPRYQRDPTRTIKTSVLGTLHLLDLAHAHRACLVQASTSEVYGDPHVHPQREDYWGHVNPIGPRACYDEGKRCAETLCFAAHAQRGVRIRVARIFNTYGPNMDPQDGRVVSNFIVQALAGAPLTLYGDGQQTRSFCYVDDLIDGLVALMTAPDAVTGPVNLGNPSEFTIRQLAERVLTLTGSSSPLSFHPLPKDDPVQRRPDITLARSLLGWQPRTDLLSGLQRTIAFFRDAR